MEHMAGLHQLMCELAAQKVLPVCYALGVLDITFSHAALAYASTVLT